MFRIRLIAFALLVSFLPGCCCWGDRDRPGLLTRFRMWRDGGSNDCACQGAPVVMGGPVMQGGPIIMQPGPGGVLPNPGGTSEPPRIPKAGITETPGKEKELDPASRPNGPTLGMPTLIGK